MTDTAGKASGRRDRSPQFPSIPLEVALNRLATFEQHFKRSPARPDNVGAAWDLDSKAYVHRISAALRYFGLLDNQGSGQDRRIVVSEEGRRYLMARQDSIKKELIQELALRPKQINLLWEKWGADRPADDVRLDTLTFEHGFSRGGAADFLKVYDATISFSGLLNTDKNIHDHSETDVGSASEASSTTDSQHDGVTEQVQQPRRVSRREGDGMKEDVFALTEGDVVLRWPELLSQESLEDLKAWTTIVLRKIEREVALNKFLHQQVNCAFSNEFSDDEEGRAAANRVKELEDRSGNIE